MDTHHSPSLVVGPGTGLVRSLGTVAFERAVQQLDRQEQANGGHAATATANTLSSGAAAKLAHNTMPNTNASHAAQRPPARRPWIDFHSSTVAVVSRPSTISGQIAAETPPHEY